MNSTPQSQPQPAVRARAGEGGGLPKGLSLFRFILFSSVMLGALYGGLSLHFNTPPAIGDTPPGGLSSVEWQPNPAWLPAFVALKANVGVTHTVAGYLYSSRLGYALHATVSLVIGMALLGSMGWFGGEAIRKWAVRKRYE